MSHRYWRVLVTKNQALSGVSCIELTMHESVGGPNVATGGVAAASSSYPGWPASNAFDGTSAGWDSDGTVPAWISYDFGAGNERDIVQITWKARSDGYNNAPRDGVVEFSDDGMSWAPAFSFASASFSSGATLSFSKPPYTGDHRFWRLYTTATGGASVSLAELTMHESVGGPNVATGGVAAASSSYPGWPASNAFDGTSAGWDSDGTVPAWISYDFGAGNERDIVQITIMSRVDSYYYFAPTVARMEFSDDGISFAPRQFFNVSATWSSGGETKSFGIGDGLVSSCLTQAPILYLWEDTPESRLTQAPSLYLYSDVAASRVSQVPVLVLADYVPCVRKWSQLWRIERTDGVVMGFTTHDEPITFMGLVYYPCFSLMGSATETNSTVGTAGDMDITGVISDARITVDDLAAGKYRGASIQVYLVPFGDANGQTPIRTLRGRIDAIKRGGVEFTATLLTQSQQLQQKAVTARYQPTCRHVLGDQTPGTCMVDLDSMAYDGSVTDTYISNGLVDRARRVFSDSSVTSDYYSNGSMLWLTGDNAGVRSEVKSSGADGAVVLWNTMQYQIKPGDTYRMWPGCDKLRNTCRDKFNNLINFGGFPDVPGPDALVQTPDSHSA